MPVKSQRGRRAHGHNEPQAPDVWKPMVVSPFIEGSRGGDDGIRRVLEMVSAAVRLN